MGEVKSLTTDGMKILNARRLSWGVRKSVFLGVGGEESHQKQTGKK